MEVLSAIEALEPSREALFEAQTAAGIVRWNEFLLVDLRFAGEGCRSTGRRTGGWAFSSSTEPLPLAIHATAL